ncbi:hypothetical protein GFL91_34410 [Rhizobium leguminosarum bv. viciae]|uniref:Uncharacterized protein n=2 Tax=Rhizobium leguminosarum TaxID=384 RepID=A0A8I2KIW7_RHILV|nr:hypothetical protein [Rhizobium leguminosarum bv. viciae]
MRQRSANFSSLLDHDAEKLARFSDAIMLYFFELDANSDLTPIRPKSKSASGGLIEIKESDFRLPFLREFPTACALVSDLSFRCRPDSAERNGFGRLRYCSIVSDGERKQREGVVYGGISNSGDRCISQLNRYGLRYTTGGIHLY